MSGGSWDYLYSRIEDAGDRLVGSKCVKRATLGRLMLRVAEAMHAIEWVDSCDWGQGDELEHIENVLKFDVSKEAVEVIQGRIDELQKQLDSLSHENQISSGERK